MRNDITVVIEPRGSCHATWIKTEWEDVKGRRTGLFKSGELGLRCCDAGTGDLSFLNALERQHNVYLL